MVNSHSCNNISYVPTKMSGGAKLKNAQRQRDKNADKDN